MHKSVRASDENASLYWLTRMLAGGEDPLYIARRLVRIAGEDIGNNCSTNNLNKLIQFVNTLPGLADPNALNLAVSCMQGCQLIGLPECDVLLAECVVYMARAKKSTEVYKALQKCRQHISDHKGPLPSVPLHLRNAPTKLMKELSEMLKKFELNVIYLINLICVSCADYGKGYNTLHKDKSNLQYMPEGMGDVDYFK